MGLRRRSRDAKVLFLPDQHLGRNTAVLELGLSARRLRRLGPAPARRRARPPRQLRDARMILWKGHCSVHGRFSADVRRRAARDDPRRAGPGAPRVHARGGAQGRPGRLDGVHHQDHRGRAGRLGWAIGTELNLVKRLARRAPRQADRVPRQDRLLLLDDEPDRPAAPGVGAGVAGRRASWSTRSRSTPTPSTGPRSRSQRMLDLPGRSTRPTRL